MTSRKVFTLVHSAMLALAANGVAAAQYQEPAPVSDYADEISFALERSPGIVADGCVEYARGEVHVTSQGPVEVMDVTLTGLPAETEFDFFVTQLPNPPFGLSWYQGDLETDAYGNASAQFIGRFNEETFIVATGAGPAPLVHGELDADVNPVTKPVHTFHLGLWFNSPVDAAYAGCPDFTTPFNGEHNAGVQVLNTGSFPNEAGPLIQLKP